MTWFLTAVAQRLLAASRASDTVGRVGGDEFVVVVEDAGQIADASSYAERLRLAVTQPVQVHGGSVDVACSIGVALSQGEQDAAALLAAADRRMYEDKTRRNKPVEVTLPVG